MNEPSPFLLYECSVQSPKWQVDYLPQFHEWLTKKQPLSFREDFCGSGKIACEWVKKSKKHCALGLDTDPLALQYATNVNQVALPPGVQERLRFQKQNVLRATHEKFDWIGAFNFSCFIFHKRKTMLRYARAAYASLNRTGTLFLETMGGEHWLETSGETKNFTAPGYGKFSQTWEQHQYDPITSIMDYSIHFRLKNGKWMNDAFTYHWRLWGIQELREVLKEAGFQKTVVLWNSADQKADFQLAENANYQRGYVAYVIGVK